MRSILRFGYVEAALLEGLMEEAASWPHLQGRVCQEVWGGEEAGLGPYCWVLGQHESTQQTQPPHLLSADRFSLSLPCSSE